MLKKRKTAAPINSNAGFDNMRLTEQSPFSVQEAYKALRTNLSFSLMNCKVVGVVSAQMHDGKSTVAINLAASFAQIGKKVLIIDSDLHLPTVAKKLNVNARPGFSDFMIGSAPFTDCIRHAAWTSVDFMPAGTLPPDPSRILDSPAMDRLFEQLKARYDLIIVDMPPINTVADAAILAKHGVEGYLVVARHDYTDLRQIKDLMKRMQMVNANVLGFVYNDVPLNGKSSYSYHYGYGYGHTYG